MSTIAGTGHSIHRNTRLAIREVLRAAAQPLHGRPPLFGLLFASTDHSLEQVQRSAGEACDAPLLCCTTAGEFSERGLTHGGIAAILVASDEMLIDVAMGRGLGPGGPAALQVCTGFCAASREASALGYAQGTSVLLMDGLSGMGDRLLREIMGYTRPAQQLCGGAAGYEGAQGEARVGLGGVVARDAVVAVHAFSSKRWGIGVGHGLRPTTERMTVTRAEGNVVYEIDERPAFSVYADYARGHGITLNEKDAGPFLLRHELGVYFLGELRTARAPLGVGPDGALICAAELPQGSTVCILDGETEEMIGGARVAAAEARAHLACEDPRQVAAVLVFDCVARGALLGSHFQREVDVVREAFPGVPVLGFLTYGEIARCRGRVEGWHNSTAVVVALPS